MVLHREHTPSGSQRSVCRMLTGAHAIWLSLSSCHAAGSSGCKGSAKKSCGQQCGQMCVGASGGCKDALSYPLVKFEAEVPPHGAYIGFRKAS